MAHIDLGVDETLFPGINVSGLNDRTLCRNSHSAFAAVPTAAAFRNAVNDAQQKKWVLTARCRMRYCHRILRQPGRC